MLETDQIQVVQPPFLARKAYLVMNSLLTQQKKTLFSLSQFNLCVDCDGLCEWRYSKKSTSLSGGNRTTLWLPVHAARPQTINPQLVPSPPPGNRAVACLKNTPNFYPFKCRSHSALSLSHYPHPLQPEVILWEAENANAPPKWQTQAED